MDTSYVYPGERFDMYLWATQGFPSIGGCGGDWGQRLSDDAYLNMLDGTGLLVHSAIYPEWFHSRWMCPHCCRNR